MFLPISDASKHRYTQFIQVYQFYFVFKKIDKNVHIIFFLAPDKYRWRHQARVERMEETEQKKKVLETEYGNTKQNLTSVQEQIKNCTNDDAKLAQLQVKLKELELKHSELHKKTEELRLQEKKTPWNVDTISKPGFAKTIINKAVTNPSHDDLSEEEKEARMRNFIKDNKKIVEQFGMLQKYDDSKKFLLNHSHLACEATANYLVIWCINLEMEKKSESKWILQSISWNVSNWMLNLFLFL